VKSVSKQFGITFIHNWLIKEYPEAHLRHKFFTLSNSAQWKNKSAGKEFN
jgi:hypothetical protein